MIGEHSPPKSGKGAALVQRAAPRDFANSLAADQQAKGSAPTAREQVLAEAAEFAATALRRAREAQRLSGGMALAEAGIATVYARRAVQLMMGVRQ